MDSLPRSHQLSGPGWTISYDEYKAREQGRREAIFALGNGVFVTRAACPEARPGDGHYPGTYRAACYEDLVSEVGGEIDELESLANLPNWLWLRIGVEGGPWIRLEEVDLLNYAHSLDVKRGVTRRFFTFRDSQDRETQICETRLVSMADPRLAALRVEVLPMNWSGTLQIDSGIDGRIENTNVARYAAYETRHIEVTDCATREDSMLQLCAQTCRSGIEIAEAVKHRSEPPPRSCEESVASEEITHRFQFDADCGQAVVLEKTLALRTSLDESQPRSAVVEALGKPFTFAQLLRQHEKAWKALWERADIRAESATVAVALRFHAFHLLQTVSPHSVVLDTGVPARGWHGEAYRGHIFWDDMFVFPFLNFRFPDLARSLLLYRCRRLDAARESARECGYRGALFPWRSAASGREVTPRYQYNLISDRWMSDPTRMQRHVNAAIVYNIWHYYLATGDGDFLQQYGAEIILEIARCWASIAEYSAEHDRYEILGVIGPDEYHNSYPDRDVPGLDNNAYTNLMAVWSLCRALEVLDHLDAQTREELKARLRLDPEEFRHWDEISRKMRIVFNDDGIISQFEGFEKLKAFEEDMLPEALRGRRVDWALEAMGSSADEYQVTKQADTLTLFYLFPAQELISLFNRLGYSLDRAQLRRTADYYLARTTHRSSLSRIIYAGALAQIDPDHSWTFFRKSLETDLRTLKGETVAEGIHLGAMGGTLDIVQRRYLGLDVDVSGRLIVDPAMPGALCRVSTVIYLRGKRIEVSGSPEGIVLRSASENNDAVELLIRDRTKSLAPGEEIYCRL
ncbi:glycoside hydrolase family 65 protein [Proteobacteria bacterium 005FR1]|nr:glycoside hydrolase family 65 protein [Proteobacteria bacterium 005FR1]